MVTVDAAVFRRRGDRWEILLIQRGRPPFEGAWALPGGFVDMEETLDHAAARELEEETGVIGVELEQLHTFGDPGRDPRGRTVSVVYGGVMPEKVTATVEGRDDAADAAWHAIDELPSLAFDHDRIIERALAWLRRRMSS